MTACQAFPSPDTHMLGMSGSRNLKIEVHMYMYLVEMMTSGLCGLWTFCEEKVQWPQLVVIPTVCVCVCVCV